ncbi:MAG: ribose 5-phosphate isomerase B [Planctomycetota bacterium]
MKIALGADHAGYDAKQSLLEHLRDAGHEVVDYGTHSHESTDYPLQAARVARSVSAGKVDRGVLVCGTGIGMSITANRFRGVRAAVVHDTFTAEVARSHNDANVLCLGSRVLGQEKMNRLVDIFLSTDFEGGRHARRVELMTSYDDPAQRDRVPSDPEQG